MPSLEENLKALPRHERIPDLLGAKDVHAPKGRRRVEWVGQASPLDNPMIVARMLAGLYTPLQEQAIRRAAAHARTRGQITKNGFYEPHRIRLLEHDHTGAQVVFQGLHETYIFSPKNMYIQDVTFHDYDVIFASNVADEFRDLEDPNRKPDPRAMLPTEEEVFKEIRRDRYEVRVSEIGVIAKT
jgi:hypothetical protein